MPQTKDVSTSSGGTLTVPALTAPPRTGGLAPALPPGALVGRGVAQTLQQLADAHNAVHGNDRRKRADLRALRAAYRRGAGRKPKAGRTRRQEGLARAQAHLAALAGKALPAEYADDRVLLPGEEKRLAVLAVEGTPHEPLAHIKALTDELAAAGLHSDDVESKAYVPFDPSKHPREHGKFAHVADAVNHLAGSRSGVALESVPLQDVKAGDVLLHPNEGAKVVTSITPHPRKEDEFGQWRSLSFHDGTTVDKAHVGDYVDRVPRANVPAIVQTLDKTPQLPKPRRTTILPQGTPAFHEDGSHGTVDHVPVSQLRRGDRLINPVTGAHTGTVRSVRTGAGFQNEADDRTPLAAERQVHVEEPRPIPEPTHLSRMDVTGRTPPRSTADAFGRVHDRLREHAADNRSIYSTGPAYDTAAHALLSVRNGMEQGNHPKGVRAAWEQAQPHLDALHEALGKDKMTQDPAVRAARQGELAKMRADAGALVDHYAASSSLRVSGMGARYTRFKPDGRRRPEKKGAGAGIETKTWSDAARAAAIEARRNHMAGHHNGLLDRASQAIEHVESNGDPEKMDGHHAQQVLKHATALWEAVDPHKGEPDYAKAREHVDAIVKHAGKVEGDSELSRLGAHMDNHLKKIEKAESDPPTADMLSTAAHDLSRQAADDPTGHETARQAHVAAADAHKAAGDERRALEHLSLADHHRDQAGGSSAAEAEHTFPDGAHVKRPDGTVGRVVGTGVNGVGVRGSDGKLTIHKPHELLPAGYGDRPRTGQLAAEYLHPGTHVTFDKPGAAGLTDRQEVSGVLSHVSGHHASEQLVSLHMADGSVHHLPRHAPVRAREANE